MIPRQQDHLFPRIFYTFSNSSALLTRINNSNAGHVSSTFQTTKSSARRAKKSTNVLLWNDSVWMAKKPLIHVSLKCLLWKHNEHPLPKVLDVCLDCSLHTYLPCAASTQGYFDLFRAPVWTPQQASWRQEKLLWHPHRTQVLLTPSQRAWGELAPVSLFA